MKHRLVKFTKNKWLIVGAVLLVVIVAYVFFRGGSNGSMETHIAAIGDVTERISVIGKVSPIGKADLAFEKSGVVKRIAVSVGSRVNRGDIIASLDSASDVAALQSAEAELADLTRDLRPEEFAANEAIVLTASTTLANAKRDAINAVRDGYVKAQSAVVNHADQLFTNPQSVHPTISIRAGSTVRETLINNERLAVTETLLRWKKDIDMATTNDLAGDLLEKSTRYAGTVELFMSNLSAIVNDLNPGNSGLSQSAIDSYVTKMNTGLSILAQAITAIAGADNDLEDAQSNYMEESDRFSLEKAGSSAEAIRAQAARVAGARAELAKDTILAPLAGVVTKAEPNLGEFVNAGQVIFAVQGDGIFKLETNVPEADIAKVALNNRGLVTLDAYGSDVVFSATVVAIDPAETVLEGVPTYKVTLNFNEKDERIRSGMTANVGIIANERSNVLTVPTRAIIDDKGAKTLRVLNPDGKTYKVVEIVVGLRGSDGVTEIVSGLSAGQEVVIQVR